MTSQSELMRTRNLLSGMLQFTKQHEAQEESKPHKQTATYVSGALAHHSRYLLSRWRMICCDGEGAVKERLAAATDTVFGVRETGEAIGAGTA